MQAPVAQWIEHRTSNPQVVGSTPTWGANFAGVAQLVERQPSKLNVVGSIPITRFRWRSSVGRAVDL